MIYTILALGAGHAKSSFFEGRCDSVAQNYRRLAQKSIMARIIDADVQLTTLQSLCLLAMSNFLGENPLGNGYEPKLIPI